MKKYFLFGGAIAILLILIAFSFAPKKKNSSLPEKNVPLKIVTTLFPLYDFAKNIGGDQVEVTLLLPPGIEAHAFEPKPGDITRINSAQIFVYTGEAMEPWVHDIIASINKKVRVIDASFDIEMMKEEEEEEHAHEEADHHASTEEHHHHGGVDPHIWLDFSNAKIMAENIAKALAEADPQNTAYYQTNLHNYQQKLTELDENYKNSLSVCQSKTIVYGGHYAFGYLAKRYGLSYAAAQGFSPDAEPTAKDMVSLVSQVRKNKINSVFYEELSSPKIAETLSRETGASLLLLNGAHNLTKEDYQKNTTFISIMEENLKNLSLGLDCKK